MSSARRRRTLALLGAVIVGALAVPYATAQAQVPPLLAPSTTTSTAPPSSPSTAAPSSNDFSSGADPAPAGAPDAKGDGAPAPSGGIKVPAEAQRVIGSVVRTGASNNRALLDSLAGLQALGLSEAETHRVGLGRFPIAGAANYTHDWLFPRYGPGFRFHLGTDVFAAHGTPVRAPVDGVLKSANNSLGGLSLKLVMPDATYFYLAHLSGLVDGFVEGMTVRTGDVVGYVGNSGNARTTPPHLHIGIYPRGGAAVDPKPILDGFIAEAQDRVPAVMAAYEASRPAAAAGVVEPEVAIAAPSPGALRPMLATGLLHPLTAGSARAWPLDALYLATANAVTGPQALIDRTVADLVAGIDWYATP